MLIVTPYIGDFTLGRKTVSSRITEIMRGTTGLTLIVAPPRLPHKCSRHMDKSHEKCYFCKGASTFVCLLDYYLRARARILVMIDLHAKIYIARNQLELAKCLTGSLNLTQWSFQYYKEIGIFTSNQKLIEKICYFVRSWTRKRFRKDPTTNKNVEMVKSYVDWKRDFLSAYPQIGDLVNRGITR